MGRSTASASGLVALDLAVALNQHNDLRSVIQDALAEFVADVEKTAAHPRRAKIVFLAIEGLKLIEAFGFFKWSSAECDQLIEDIRALLKPDASPRLEKRKRYRLPRHLHSELQEISYALA